MATPRPMDQIGLGMVTKTEMRGPHIKTFKTPSTSSKKVIFQQDIRQATNDVTPSGGRRHVQPTQSRPRSSWGKKKIVYTPGPAKGDGGERRYTRSMNHPQDTMQSQIFSPVSSSTGGDGPSSFRTNTKNRTSNPTEVEKITPMQRKAAVRSASRPSSDMFTPLVQEARPQSAFAQRDRRSSIFDDGPKKSFVSSTHAAKHTQSSIFASPRKSSRASNGNEANKENYSHRRISQPAGGRSTLELI